MTNNSTPQTPAEWRAEQERVLGLLKKATNPDSWYFQPGWGLQCFFPDGLGLLAPDDGGKTGDLLLMEAAPALATAYAEACGQIAALREALKILHEGWERDGILLYAQEAIMEADGTTTWLDRECRTEYDTLRRCADELEAVLGGQP